MKIQIIKKIIIIDLLFFAISANAENIDPYENASQYAYGGTVGWVNFEPNRPEPNVGAHITSDKITGFIWGENIGWISLSCENTESCGRVEYGVVNDGNGNLSGYAWGVNIGWIKFDPNVPGDANDYRVKIDEDGYFSGYAWAENFGWISFNTSEYRVRACVVGLDDFANFADDWLSGNPVAAGNLNGDEDIDFGDHSVFANYWRDYCPDGWGLK